MGRTDFSGVVLPAIRGISDATKDSLLFVAVSFSGTFPMTTVRDFWLANCSCVRFDKGAETVPTPLLVSGLAAAPTPRL
jgi:hypothetical protein